MGSDELLFVVDENDNPLKPLPRSQVISQGLWRRTGTAVLVDTHNARILCQKRSESKDERPGFWIAAGFGGKSLAGDTPEQTAVRELREELGLKVKPSELHFFKKVISEERNQMEYVYWLNWIGEISKLIFDPEEVAEIKWYSFDVVKDLLKTSRQWYNYGFEIDLLDSVLSS